MRQTAEFVSRKRYSTLCSPSPFFPWIATLEALE